MENNERFSIEGIYNLMRQLNKTFKIMENNNIVHRDIKLDNILIKYKDYEHKDFIVKLCDYGSSKKIAYYTILKTHTGTLYTMAPEILEGEEEEENDDEENNENEKKNMIISVIYGV